MNLFKHGPRLFNSVYFVKHVQSRVRMLQSVSQNAKEDNRDREVLFLDSRVQSILSSITGFDESKIFNAKPISNYRPPKYMFLTDEELKITRQRAYQEGRSYLQMPPIMNPWQDNPQILAKHPELQGHDTCNYILTDVSKGFTDRTRLIVVREPNGVLRRANWEERYRMNQIHYPLEGRSYETPKMFQEEHLKNVLDRFDYLFVLDRACIQFEPDDPVFLKTVYMTYEHILEHGKFDLLRSTRYFGLMAFYYAFESKIDALLSDMIERKLLADGASLVNLYYILNEKESELDLESDNYLSIIKKYMVHESQARHLLETSLSKYQQMVESNDHSSN